MRINRTKRRTASDPLNGVTFTATDDRAARDKARALAGSGLTGDDLRAIREAMGWQSIRLEDAGEWTASDSAVERFRADRYERTLILYRAAEMALARVDDDTEGAA